MHGNEGTQAHIPHHIAEAARHTLRVHPTVRQAVLFGSRARGDHRPDSDWDIALIVGETNTAYKEIEATLAKLSGVSPMCVREAAMRDYAHRTDTVHAAIASEGVVIAGSTETPQAPPKDIKVGWHAVKAELAEAQRTMRALTVDDVESRIAPFTRRAVVAFATAQVLTLKLVPQGRKDAETLIGQLRQVSTDTAHATASIVEAATAALQPQCKTREEALWALIALNRAWCDAQPMQHAQARHCVAQHLDATRIEFARTACDRRDAPAQALRAAAREAIRSLDTIAGAGRSMPPIPWAAKRGSKLGSWIQRIARMEKDARTLVRARTIAAAPGSARARPIARAPAREPVPVHKAAARLARLAWHNNVGGLRRAHRDHWMRNPYLWQLVEAGALAGRERREAAEELLAYPRIAPWAAWPHALVRCIENKDGGALKALPRAHEELVGMAQADNIPHTAAADFTEGPELTIEVDAAHVTLRAEDGTQHVIGRVPAEE